MRAIFTSFTAFFLVVSMDNVPLQAAEEGGNAPAHALMPKMSNPVMDLRRWSPEGFHADYVALINQLGVRHGAEKQDSLLDAAELYVAHMLLFEGGSVLEGAAPVNVAQKLRHRALQDAVTLLKGGSVADFDSSPLNDPGREDRAFWQFLQAIGTADGAMLTGSFGQSASGLGLQSRAVLRAVLPLYAEAAAELDAPRVADAAIRTMKELPGLYDSPTGQFVIGRAEEARGNEASALEAYLNAAEGWDKYAVRARLAVADMALRSDSKGALLAAADVLEKGRESWRGGQFELDVLQRLADVRGAMDKPQAQLLALGRLIARFPQTDEAVTALMEAERLLSEIYRDGTAGEIPLAEWMELHTGLLAFFRDLPSFPARTEQLASYLAELGATDLAEREYRRAIDLLQEGDSLNPEMTEKSLVRLSLKLARTQLRAGRADAAHATLEALAPMTPDQSLEKVRLKADALADLGQWEALVDTALASETPRHLRNLARAHADKGRWGKSRDSLMRFWMLFPEAFGVTDASFLLVAANRAQDPATRDRVIRSFPSLSGDDALVQLAASMQAEMPALMPLRIDAASARLERLEDAFDKIAASQAPGPDGAVSKE